MPIRNLPTTTTGIYRKVSSRLEVKTPADFYEMLATVPADHAGKMDDVLDAIERQAQAILAPYAIDGKPLHALPKVFPPTVKPHEVALAEDARDSLYDVVAFRQLLHGADVGRVALAAFMLGRLAERMDVRPFEPHAKRAIVTERKRKEGHERKYNATAKRRAVQQAAKRLRRDAPDIKKTALVRRIRKAVQAAGLMISERTVWSYLKVKPK